MVSKRSNESWALAWFLRGRLLDRIVLIVCGVAVVTEFCVLLLHGEPPAGFLGLLLSAIGVVLARFRRTAGFFVIVLGAVAAALWSSEFIATWSIVVFQLFSVTVRGTRAIPALLLGGVPVYLAIVAREGWDFQAPVALVASACCAVGAAVGSAVRAQERYLESMKQRALDAEATAQAELERGIAEERLRIARDLHDIVGHEIAVVNMNLGAAEVQLSPDESKAKSSLEAARAGLQRILQETQQILAILRRGHRGKDTPEPVASVTRLAELLRSMKAGGASIEEQIDDVGDLSPTVSAAAYRIAQEALTNAQRYGTGTAAFMLLRRADEIIVEVSNPRSPTPAKGGSGYGVVGMRERAESVGGSLSVTDDPDEFRIRATLNAWGKTAL